MVPLMQSLKKTDLAAILKQIFILESQGLNIGIGFTSLL